MHVHCIHFMLDTKCIVSLNIKQTIFEQSTSKGKDKTFNLIEINLKTVMKPFELIVSFLYEYKVKIYSTMIARERLN